MFFLLLFYFIFVFFSIFLLFKPIIFVFFIYVAKCRCPLCLRYYYPQIEISKLAPSDMANKWLVYISTFLTYSLVHSIRTCWASLKSVLTSQPFEFSQRFLGTMDMIVLFTISILLNIFGRHVERYPRRKILAIMMVGLSINLFILFLMLVKQVTSQPLYFLFFMIVGVLSCLAWPVCLYTTSQYFDSRNATALSMWSSVSQCGDFIAFLITLIVFQVQSIPEAYSMLFLMILFIMVSVFDYFFFRDKGNHVNMQRTAVNQVQTPQLQVRQEMKEPTKGGSDSHLKQISQQKQKSEKFSQKSDSIQKQRQQSIQAHPQQNAQPHASPEHQLNPVTSDNQSNTPPNPQNHNNEQQQQKQQQLQAQPQNSEKPVTFLTVWLLPGVALPVLAFSTVKSINAIIVSWLVLYFTKIDMIKESRIIAIGWTFSIVLGGYIGAKVNSFLSYKIFIGCLFISTFIFYFLEGLHMHTSQIAIIGLVSICGMLVGGPYNQLGTSVPLKLSQDPQIRRKPQAKSAIISLMESFGQLTCGICILIVPGIGVMKLHYMACALCFISVLLLSGQQLRQFLQYKQIIEGLEAKRAAPPPIELKEQI